MSDYNTGSLGIFIADYLHDQGVTKMKPITPEMERIVEQIARKCKYEGYLQSKAWMMKRRAKLNEMQFKCEDCGYDALTNPVTIPLDVHHKSYRHLFDEPLSDLMVLCRTCHGKRHGKVQTIDNTEPF